MRDGGYQWARMENKPEEFGESEYQTNEDRQQAEVDEGMADAAAEMEEAANQEAEEKAVEPGVEEAEEPVEEAKELTVEEEMMKWRDAAMRSRAEMENYRKRMVREKSEAIRYASRSLLEELLPVVDNFGMGLAAAEQDQDSMIYMGMKMVKEQLDRFLDAQGVKEMPVAGEFDPNLHDAISEEVSTEVEPGHILRVQRKGYLLHDRLLRAATVVVAKDESGEENAKNEEK